MGTELRKFGNSKGIIIPSSLIKKYNLQSIELIETDKGILIKSIKNISLLQQKIESSQLNRKKIYEEMKSQADNMTSKEHSDYENEVEDFNDYQIIEE